MLRPLYDYAMRYQLLPPPGMVKKTVKAWVCLGANGTFLGVRQDGEDEYFCPDIGSLANGKDKCNVLVEKYEVVFWKDTPESKVEQREEGKSRKTTRSSIGISLLLFSRQRRKYLNCQFACICWRTKLAVNRFGRNCCG